MGRLEEPATVERYDRNAELFRTIAELNHDEEVKRVAASVAEEYEAMSPERATGRNLLPAGKAGKTLTRQQRSQAPGYINRRGSLSLCTRSATGRDLIGGKHENTGSKLLASVWMHLTAGKEAMTTISRMTMVLMIFSYALAH
jgi:hypothetical protein